MTVDARTLDCPVPSELPQPGVDALAAEQQRQRLLTKMFGLEAEVQQLQHYVLLEELGRGGMGVVYEAYDRKLDRKVAIKLLRSRRRGREAKIRLGREAQGLAKLSHPNVVQIYEIGEHEGTQFLAMEFVVGQTLRQWLGRVDERDQRAHSLEAKLEMLLQAGRGLAAAHAAGLVHRDFKPDNVMVGDDGRARVLDFGLVRGARRVLDGDELASTVNEMAGTVDEIVIDTEGDTERAGLTAVPPSALLERSLTEVGTIMGTPAYMAPEQHAGRPCSAPADQFAYCVVAFEMLYGRRPFNGATLKGLAAAVSAGEIAWPSDRSESEVPARVREAILRGLRVDVGERWPDMQALLDGLQACLAKLDGSLTRLRRRWAGVALGVSGVAVAVTMGLMPAAEQSQMCVVDRSALAGTWDDARRDALRERFLATNFDFAEPLFNDTEQALDGWSEEWVEAQRQACEATWVSGVQSELGLDKRTACLDRKRRDLVTLVDVLLEVDAKAVANTSEVLSRLPDVGACSDVANLDVRFPRPREGERLATLHALEAGLERVRILMLVGERARARSVVDELQGEVADLDHVPLTIEARALAAELSLQDQNFGESVPAMLAVAREAEVLHLDDLTATIRVRLANKLSGTWSQPQKEQWLLADAEAALRRVGRDGDPRELDLLLARASLRCQAGDHEGALDLYRQAPDQFEGPIGYQLEIGAANELTDLGRFEQAEATYGRVRDSVSARYGDNAPLMADVERNLGLLALERGELEAAKLHLESALAIYSTVFGPHSLQGAPTRFALAKAAMAVGELDEARAGIDAALLVFETVLGPTHQLTGQALNGRGVLHFFMGEYRASIVDYERALLIQRELLGALHEEIGVLHSNIGESRVALGQHEGALEDFDRALFVLRSTPDHPHLALPHKGRGQALLALGRAAEAADALERALAVVERSSGEPYEVADIRLTLAQTLAALGREPDRVRELASAARETFVDFGATERAQAADAVLLH